MTYSEPARPTHHQTRRRTICVAGLLAIVAAIAAALSYHLPASSSSTVPSPRTAPSFTPSTDAPPRDTVRGERTGGLGATDGAVPDGTSAFDDEVPGVGKLDPALRRALRRAEVAAADDGVELYVDSGWRSPEYQERLLDEAVRRYGSGREAARWVATPNRSAHVSGEAVDIGPSRAAAWLSEHGAPHGLCQIYANEPWHYELRRPEARREGCPAMYPDPTHDPRMQQ